MLRDLSTILLIFISYCSFGQVSTTEGNDFWLAFMENHNTSPIELELHLSAKDSTGGNVSVAGIGFNYDFSINSYSSIVISVPIGAMLEGSERVTNQAIHITSVKNISVYALNKRDRSADASVILPIETLGKEYLITSYRGVGPSRYSEFVIVGTSNNTKIEITPSGNTVAGRKATEPFTITLDKGDTYQIQSLEDLSGTLVRTISDEVGDCNTFAVFSGNEWTNVGGCGPAQDHIYEQMFPINTWGNEFTVVPLKTRNGDLIKIMSGYDDNLITVGNNEFTLNKGRHFSFTSSAPLSIISKKPISVAQFSRSQSCDNQNGDPFMIMLSPNEQMLNEVTFDALEVFVIDNFYLNIVIDSFSRSSIILDGVNIGKSFIDIENSKYSYAQLDITQGTHTMSSPSGFIAYVYGFGPIESFGYSAGASLDNLLLQVSHLKESASVIGIDSICVNEPFKLAVQSDEVFQFFEWNMNDGTSLNGDTITHFYDKPGEYNIVMKGLSASGNCAYEQISRFKMVVLSPEPDIFGPTSVCPDTEDITYFTEPTFGYSYAWDIIGGAIADESRRDSIVVNWGTTSEIAEVSLIATNTIGCIGEPTKLPVKINIQLDPVKPFGLDSICQNSPAEKYYVYKNNTSIYTWEVEKGSIISGQGTNEVEIEWEGFGERRLYYGEQSIELDVCAGESDTLNIFVERQPDPNLQIEALNQIQLGDTSIILILYDSAFNFASYDFGDGFKLDSVKIDSLVSYMYNCPGIYSLDVSSYTGTVCQDIGIGTLDIEVIAPEVSIINVSVVEDKLIEINWEIASSENYNRPFILMRRVKDTDNWQDIATLQSDILSFIDQDVEVDDTLYDYQIQTNRSCELFSASLIHNNILLKAFQENGMGFLNWNPYVNWENGVEDYKIDLFLDGVSAQFNESATDFAFEFEYQNLGFSHCFQIKANQNNSDISSYSNIACLEFIPELKFYNVITPNNDGKNDRFIIENITQYPNSELIILNRYGKRIFQRIGYQNNWSGEEVNSGVYYWLLKLNEPKNPTNETKGILTILK